MTDLATAIEAFLRADVRAWRGLPPVTVGDLTDLLGLTADDAFPGDAGDPPTQRVSLAADSGVYAGGLRVWLDPDHTDRVVLLEGTEPMDADEEFWTAPDLGEPEALLEVALGPFWFTGGEQVHADRGLAVRVNPDNGLLLGVLGFAPTTAADYRSRLRPVTEPRRPLQRQTARGSR